jgi:hypothetical protein
MAWKAGWPSMGAKNEDDSLTPRLGWTGWGQTIEDDKEREDDPPTPRFWWAGEDC